MKRWMKKVLVAIGLSALLVGGTMVAAAPAQAGGFTQLCNHHSQYGGSFGISYNGVNYAPLPSGCVWGVTHIRVQPWTCVYISAHGRGYCANSNAWWVATYWNGYGHAYRY
jgi:hypothetical protein